MLIGLTHTVSPNLAQGELTYIDRAPVDHTTALPQHDQYYNTLAAHGVEVKKLTMNSDYPDSCFVEDTAIVLDEIAIITRMGTTSRRGETAGIVAEISKYRETVAIQQPATIEGGDVLHVGKTLFVGLSTRTNTQGIEALTTIAKRFGYKVIPVPVTGCLHLKTACTAVSDDTLLLNPLWIDTAPLQSFTLLPVSLDEPWAANTVRIGNTLCVQAGFPNMLEQVHTFADRIEPLDISEFRKVEAGPSCLSVLFEK